MIAVIERLPDHPGYRPPEPFAGPDHPIRQITRAAALERRWTADDARRLGATFDGLAAGWSAEHVDDTKAAPLRDALDRGGVDTDGWWIEFGSGTGAGVRVVHDRVQRLVCVDVSAGMLAEAPPLAPRVQADASRSPFPDRVADVVLCINMLLFPDEVDRLLGDGGQLVWINTLGDQTPIHLPPTDVVAALPGSWRAVTARAGTGEWSVVTRR